jgi:hypothetical protein
MEWKIAAREELSRLFQLRDDASNIAEETMIHLFGNAQHALLYADLFLPELAEVDGIIFLKANVESSSAKEKIAKMKEDGLSEREIARSFNLFEVAHAFADASSSEKVDELLAHAIRDAWSTNLKAKYPSRSFNVEILPFERTGDVGTLTFYEYR